MVREARILEIIQEAAIRFNVFPPVGPGHGNKVTSAALAYMNALVGAEFGKEVLQQGFGGKRGQTVDFLLRPEKTVIEVEFSLSNPYPCLEKDLFKLFLGKALGVPLERLVLVGDPGCKRRLDAPAPRAIIRWAREHQGIAVEVVELRSETAEPLLLPAVRWATPAGGGS